MSFFDTLKKIAIGINLEKYMQSINYLESKINPDEGYYNDNQLEINVDILKENDHDRNYNLKFNFNLLE